MSKLFQIYSGKGEKGNANASQPIQPLVPKTAPEGYLAPEGLIDAVNVALQLGMPLFLTGEPGTGKTQLAFSIAWELNLGNPFVFHTKTTSSATNLFYSYDNLAHFHDAQFKNDFAPDARKYVMAGPLGKAILLSKSETCKSSYLGAAGSTGKPGKSIVLIDEIDKAPRDFPNDILHEIESLEFHIRESGETFSVDPAFRPIVIMTSNSEKNMPDAFLRRCVFYHIPFPSGEHLAKIVLSRLHLSPLLSESNLAKAIQKFEEIRELGLQKKPATGELLSWITILDSLGIDFSKKLDQQWKSFETSLGTLAKNSEDFKTLKEKLKKLIQ